MSVTLIQHQLTGERIVFPGTEWVIWLNIGFYSTNDNSFFLKLIIFFLFRFLQTWKITNTGKEKWPEECRLVCIDGYELCHGSTWQSVVSLKQGESTYLNVNLRSPMHPGVYESKWQMLTSDGSNFGGIKISVLFCLVGWKWLMNIFHVFRVAVCENYCFNFELVLKFCRSS